MKRTYALVSAVAALVLAVSASNVNAVQYPTVDPAYTQEIYTGPLVGGPGMAWTPTNNLLSRNGSDVLEYSLTQNTVHQGTNLHGTIATHTIAGLLPTGYGMTNGTDGYVYTVTGSGLQRFDPGNFAAPAQTLGGTAGGQGYGITTLSDGRIAYSDGNVNSKLYVYDPVATTNTLIYTAGYLIDGMVGGPGGHIAVAGQSNSSIEIFTATGSVVNSFVTPHYPDGLAFATTAAGTILYSNNNNGTISKYVLGPGYTGVPVITDIAGVSGAYGDLASVGPDCAFYVSQFNQPIAGYHGSVLGIGTHWDNGVTNTEASIIRIGSAPSFNPDGTVNQDAPCQFYSPIDGGVPYVVPTPSAALLGSLGMAGGLLLRRSRRR